MSLLLLIFSASRSGLSFSCHNFSLFAEVRMGVVLSGPGPFPTVRVTLCCIRGPSSTWGRWHLGLGWGTVRQWTSFWSRRWEPRCRNKRAMCWGCQKLPSSLTLTPTMRYPCCCWRYTHPGWMWDSWALFLGPCGHVPPSFPQACPQGAECHGAPRPGWSPPLLPRLVVSTLSSASISGVQSLICL